MPTAPSMLSDDAMPVLIGNRNEDDRTFDGRIKRVAVWPEKLTVRQWTAVCAQGPDYVTP